MDPRKVGYRRHYTHRSGSEMFTPEAQVAAENSSSRISVIVQVHRAHVNAFGELKRGLAGAGRHYESAGRAIGDDQPATTEPKVPEWLHVLRVGRHGEIRCGFRVAGSHAAGRLAVARETAAAQPRGALVRSAWQQPGLWRRSVTMGQSAAQSPLPRATLTSTLR